MKLRIIGFLLLLPSTVSAAAMPSWVNLLPHGELKCVGLSAGGLKWNEGVGAYVHTQYNHRDYIIQRLDISDPKNTKHDCKLKDKKEYFRYEDSYTISACYRYNNSSLALDFTRGWCRETYTRKGPIYVTCDYNYVFQPKIGFSPSGYFYSYGHARHGTIAKPGLEDIFIESGRCNNFIKGYDHQL